MPRGRVFLAILVAFAAACNTTHRVVPLKVPMQVELDAFSGRPNPEWQLTDQQSAEFLLRLRSLKPRGGPSISFDVLGYRGFVVRARDEAASGFEQVRVFKGQVAAVRRAGTVVLEDNQNL